MKIKLDTTDWINYDTYSKELTGELNWIYCNFLMKFDSELWTPQVKQLYGFFGRNIPMKKHFAALEAGLSENLFSELQDEYDIKRMIKPQWTKLDEMKYFNKLLVCLYIYIYIYI